MNTVRYRIYTEDKERETILEEVSACFPCFTATRGIGYWNGKEEEALTIEIIATDSIHDSALVVTVAQSIRLLNNQDSVLLTEEPVYATYFER